MPALKHYNRYLKKIERYAEAVGIKILWQEDDCEGAWIESRRAVRVDPTQDEDEEIATLLHELGHALDVFLMLRSSRKKLDKCYKAFYGNRASVNQRLEVIKCEKRAWDIGRTIAKQLRVPIGKWYAKVSARCLNAYRKH